MSRNYKVRHYIQQQVHKYYSDNRLSDLLFRCFEQIDKTQDYNGCLSTSVALYVCLSELGYSPKLCYGLCHTQSGFEFYHAWIELEDKVIDIAVYGNLNFNRLVPKSETVEFPVVLETYDNSYITYGRFVFDDYWCGAAICHAENWTILQYVNNVPNNGMYRIISVLMNDYVLYRVKDVVCKYSDVLISESKP